jgi:DNA-binding ferritin-like protein (Dps family)
MTQQNTPSREDYDEIKRRYMALSEEYAIVIRTVVKTMHVVGLWPITDDKMNTSRILKTVSSLAVESMLPGSNIKERFAFVKDILPIAEKYKDIDPEKL